MAFSLQKKINYRYNFNLKASKNLKDINKKIYFDVIHIFKTIDLYLRVQKKFTDFYYFFLNFV